MISVFLEARPRPARTLKAAVAELKMAHLRTVAFAFEHLHHFDRP
jgi:hypothetical protein